MGRAPCCDKEKVKKGPWSPDEDAKLKDYIQKTGTGGNWIALPQKAGLRRCGKSCRLRWLNYLRPNIKHGEFSDDEDRIICTLFASIGSRWSIMAAQLPGRTDNDIKNYWNTKLKKKLLSIDPQIGKPLHHPEPVNYSSNCSYPSSFTAAAGTTATDYHPVVQSGDHGYIDVGPMETYQVKDSSTLLMFGAGGDQASCSSPSDGSCHYEYGDGVFDDRNNIGGLTSDSYKGPDGNCEKASGHYWDSSLESSLEQFKLISTNLCGSNINDGLDLFDDEIKAEENIMY